MKAQFLDPRYPQAVEGVGTLDFSVYEGDGGWCVTRLFTGRTRGPYDTRGEADSAQARWYGQVKRKLDDAKDEMLRAIEKAEEADALTTS
jgi:hypothetical protein